MGRISVLISALCFTFFAGLWAGIRWAEGVQAREEQALRALQDEASRKTREAEMLRLQDEKSLDLQMGVVLDAVRSDPDGVLPAFGLRDTKRLNEIR